MGVALHSETKCRYYILFHTEAEKLFGASDEETRRRSTTPRCRQAGASNSTAMQQDHDEFAEELQQVGAHLSQSQEVARMRLERVGQASFCSTLHGYELATITAAARLVAESEDPSLTAEAAQQLRQTLTAYDVAAAEVGSAEAANASRSSFEPSRSEA